MATTTQLKKKSNGSDTEHVSMSCVYYAADPIRHWMTGMSGIFPHDFVAVASVESDDLDEIWKLFNEIEQYDNIPDAYVILRSMSIGDAVTKADGTNWILTHDTGWTPIDFNADKVLNEKRYQTYWTTLT